MPKNEGEVRTLWVFEEDEQTATLHTSLRLFEKGAEVLMEVDRVDGVVSVEAGKYHLILKKGWVFDWNEITREVIYVLSGIFQFSEREITPLSKIDKRAQSLGNSPGPKSDPKGPCP